MVGEGGGGGNGIWMCTIQNKVWYISSSSRHETRSIALMSDWVVGIEPEIFIISQAVDFSCC